MSPSQASTPFASYNGSPMFNGTNGPQAWPYPGPAAAPGVNGYSQQNRQAFMAETQRMGAQQNLTPQEVVAMSRSGMPDTQIAIAIQQRGAVAQGDSRRRSIFGRQRRESGRAQRAWLGDALCSGLPRTVADGRRAKCSTAWLSAGRDAVRAGRAPGAGNLAAPMNMAINSRRSQAATRAFNRPDTRRRPARRATMLRPRLGANRGVPMAH